MAVPGSSSETDLKSVPFWEILSEQPIGVFVGAAYWDAWSRGHRRRRTENGVTTVL